MPQLGAGPQLGTAGPTIRGGGRVTVGLGWCAVVVGARKDPPAAADNFGAALMVLEHDLKELEKVVGSHGPSYLARKGQIAEEEKNRAESERRLRGRQGER